MAKRNKKIHRLNPNAKNPTLDFISFVLKEYPLRIFIVIVAIVVSALATIKGTLFMKNLVDDYIVPMTKVADPDFGPLAMALFKITLIYLAGALCSYGYNVMMVYVSQGTIRRVRHKLFKHMESLPISFFDRNGTGNVMSVYSNDTDTLREFLTHGFPQLLSSLFSVITTFGAMAMLNVPLTVLSTIMVVIMLFVTKKTAKLSSKYFIRRQENIGEMNSYIEEMTNGQKVIKVFSHEDQSIDGFKKLNEALRESTEKANTYGNILMPIIMQIGNISYVLCAIVGGILSLNGYLSLTVGTLVSFMTLNRSFNQPFSQIGQQLNSVIMASAGVKRIYALLGEHPEKNSGHIVLTKVKKDADGNFVEVHENIEKSPHEGIVLAWKNVENGNITFTEVRGDILFEDVSFGYVQDVTVLHDINIFAHTGQKIALVGSTGAGKTTITNLINRFYDIQNGSILYDGINIKDIEKPSLRKSLSIVLQDTHLFTGSILDNIRYGRLCATDEECVAAAKLANAHGFIEMLPDGYNTVIESDGGNLSQGQQQLLAIARAAVANPAVLILDEATSSIDTHTEKLVQSGMDKLMENRTTFVIAHRLSTIKSADCIMVIEGGRIIERGNHEELLQKQGRYHQLYTGATTLS